MADASAPATIASEAEIESALAQAAATSEMIPSLDDAVIAVPVELPTDLRGGLPTFTPDAIRAPAVIAPSSPDAFIEPAAPTAAPNKRSIGDVIYMIADSTLSFINAPFRSLTSEAKSVVLAGGIVSLVISLAAAVALPMLFPPPDPAQALRARVVAAEASAAAAAHAETPAGEPSHGEPAKSAPPSGH